MTTEESGVYNELLILKSFTCRLLQPHDESIVFIFIAYAIISGFELVGFGQNSVIREPPQIRGNFEPLRDKFTR